MGNNQVLKFELVVGLQPIIFDLTIGKQPYITYFMRECLKSEIGTKTKQRQLGWKTKSNNVHLNWITKYLYIHLPCKSKCLWSDMFLQT